MKFLELSDSQRSFALVSLLLDGDGALALLSFLQTGERNILEPALKELLTLSKPERNKTIVSEMKQLKEEATKSPLAEIHPDWILEALVKEPPRVIAIVLKYLPSEHVRSILDRLPPEVLQNLPRLSQLSHMDEELFLTMRSDFENRFRVSDTWSGPVGHSFESIPHLSRFKLEMMFRELGYAELAMAILSLNEKGIDFILARLEKKEATILKRHVEQKRKVPLLRLKQAQSHFLSLDLNRTSTEGLVMDAGFFVFSKSLLPQDSQAILLMKRHFSKIVANQLQKYIDKNQPINTEKTVARYREEILNIVLGLVGQEI